MTETRTCFRCGREGSRMFELEANAATGMAQWRCVNRVTCKERTWRNIPCRHDSEHAGLVHAGELKFSKPHCSVHTCPGCVPASQAYVTAVTGGLPASELIPFTRGEVVEPSTGCGACHWCENQWQSATHALNPQKLPLGWGFIVCPDCGNKRCPKATHHDHACTRNNEPGQSGSVYGDFVIDTSWLDNEGEPDA